MLPSTNDGKSLQPDFGLYTEAAGLLAILDFNNRNGSIVPNLTTRLQDCNVRLTMEFQDTQFSPIEASRVLTQEVLLREHSLTSPQPISMIGATRSAVSAPLAVLGGIHELPLISYGSTSSELDDKDSYPYFGRTVPTNEGDAVAAVSYLRHVLGATHCGVIYVKDGFGLAFLEEFLRAGRLLDPPMNVISAPYDPEAEASIESAIGILRRSRFKYIFGIISTPTHDAVMRQAYNAGIAGVPGMVWFLSSASGQLTAEGFGYDATTQADIAAASNSVGIISLDINDNDAFSSLWETLESNAALKEYFVSKHDSELDFSSFKFAALPSYWEYLQYDAIMAVGLAACDVKEEFFNGRDLFEKFIQTSFEGASGLVEFKSSGTRDYTSLSYKVENIVARSPNEQGRILFDAKKTSILEGSQWIHVDSFIYSDGTATKPAGSGLPILTVDLNLIGDGARIVGLLFAALAMASSLGLAIWTIVRRKSVVVRVSQPFFLGMICIGTFMMGSSIIFMSLQEPVSQTVLDGACMLVPYLLSVGFVTAFPALLSKTLRINKLMGHSQACRRVVVRRQDVLIPFMTLFAINLIILVSWTAIDPLEWVRTEKRSFDEFGRSVESYGACESEWQLVFYILIGMVVVCSLLVANAANYRARHISGELHEGKWISLSTLILLEATIIGIPALLTVSDRPTEFFLMRSALVVIICAAILAPLFVPKIIQARKDGYSTRRRRGGQRSAGSEKSRMLPTRSSYLAGDGERP
jgi:gamma-aminobutyric acid type B receptor